MKYLLPAAAALLAFVSGAAVAQEEFAELREKVLGLEKLTPAPAIHPATGFEPDGVIRPIFYDALPWKGNPTRVFAWLGVPAVREGKLPAMVLVHGGGGTAFKEWVQKWNERGYAAISIAVEGQTDRRQPDGKTWERHEFSGPLRSGIYADSAESLADQWMYHAVADTVLANSLLRSLPEVDPRHVGLMGISWGGIVTSTVIGIDRRFAFAIPTYGCGHLFDAENQYGRALGDNALYREVWDPMIRMSRVKMPVLWFTWLRDVHFPLTAQSACYRAAPGPRTVAVLPGMGHSHQAGWNPPDSYAFADAIVQTGKPWWRQVAQSTDGPEVWVEFDCTRPTESAELWSTSAAGFTGSRPWSVSPAKVTKREGRIRIEATLPAGTKAWFVNVRSVDLTASSDFFGE